VYTSNKDKLWAGDIYRQISDEHEVTFKDVKIIIDSFINKVKQNLISGTACEVSDFGVFKPILKKARNFYNPSTGDMIARPNWKAVSFKMCSKFRGELG
jgi:nucleoid DNA-binding protein